ncbi:hypothetical protein BS17DRAFT_790408 [Gyrodon lividus]|nr:hypothetical protein BS17DRAFT_790408 [Gyrodon lividus]
MIAHSSHRALVLLLAACAPYQGVTMAVALAVLRVDHTQSLWIESPSPMIPCTLKVGAPGVNSCIPVHHKTLDHREDGFGSEETQHCAQDAISCTMDNAGYLELQLEPGHMEHGVHAEEEPANHGDDPDKNGIEQQLAEKPTDDTNGEGNQLQDMPPKSITTVLLLTSSGLVLLAVIVILRHCLPRPLQRWIRKYTVSSRFHVGEARLLQWAYEDAHWMGSKEDFMVNGGDDSIDDDNIPLKPTPRKNFSVHYGSAQGK